jgi:hypothetical protein
MKVKEVLNTFFHVYAINMIVIVCDYFFDILYHAFTLDLFGIVGYKVVSIWK